MPSTSLSENEIEELTANILAVGGRTRVEALLSTGILADTSTSPFQYPGYDNKYFKRSYLFKDYELLVYRYYADGDCVCFCDLQFRRPRSFNPFTQLINRNSALTSKLESVARKHYGTWGERAESRENGARFRDVFFGRPISKHDLGLSPNVRHYFEETGAECLIGSELDSGGYDFVSFRFRRLGIS